MVGHSMPCVTLCYINLRYAKRHDTCVGILEMYDTLALPDIGMTVYINFLFIVSNPILFLRR